MTVTPTSVPTSFIPIGGAYDLVAVDANGIEIHSFAIAPILTIHYGASAPPTAIYYLAPAGPNAVAVDRRHHGWDDHRRAATLHAFAPGSPRWSR